MKLKHKIVSIRMISAQSRKTLNALPKLKIINDTRKYDSQENSEHTCTISSSSDAILGRLSLESMRILALVILLISVTIAPPLPIKQPIRDVGTRRRVVNEIIPESLSTFSLHLGCKRTAASTVAEYGSSKN